MVKIICPKCGSDHNISKGKEFMKRLGYYKLDRKCKGCGKRFLYDPVINGEPDTVNKEKKSKKEKSVEVFEKHNVKEVTVTDIVITTLDELIEYSNIDTNIWNIDKHIINKWGTNWQVKAFMSKKEPDKQIVKIPEPVRFNILNPKKSGFSDKIRSVKLKGGVKRSVIFGDGQFGFLKNQNTGELTPLHDRKCNDVIYKVIADIQPDEVIYTGDGLDLAEASKFEKKKEFYFTVQPAINEFGYYLAKVRNATPKAKFVFLNGNHDARLNRHVQDHMVFSLQLRPYNVKESIYSLDHLLGFRDLGIEFIPNWPEGEYFINNQLKVKHGEFTSIDAELKRTYVSVIQSHLHRIERVSKTFSNSLKQVTVTSTGCTCHIDGRVPSKNSVPDWQQGFCYVESTENRFNIQHVVIIDGKCIFRDKLYEGIDYTPEIKEIISL